MKKIFLVCLIAAPALAATDYACMNNCTAQNYQYRYCQSVCSYDTAPPQPQIIGPNDGYLIPAPRMQQQTDYTCMANCQNAGSQYQYCKQVCSY